MDYKTGKILKGQKGLFDVVSDSGRFACRAATKLRNQKKTPVTGDIVVFEDNGDETGFIIDIKEPKNSFIRPSISNIDLFAVVAAVKDPEPAFYNIDKLTAVSSVSNTETIIIINKTDLKYPGDIISVYRQAGYRVFPCSAGENEGIEEIRECLYGKTTVFTGASGVGKSSLLNRLYPNLKLETGETSRKIERGRNTTRTTELFPTTGGGFIADTPGFTMLDLVNYDILRLSDMEFAFPEMAIFLNQCKFKKCTHTKEDGCAVIKAVKDGTIPAARHESYIKMYNELKTKPVYLYNTER